MARRPLPIHLSDVRGAAKLATDATVGLTDLVEAMHARIASLPGVAVAEPARTRGITGLVYKAIRGVTHGVGGGIEALLRALPSTVSASSQNEPEREAVVAAINGVLGDHLVATNNSLATPMTLRWAGELSPHAPSQTVLILVHGLCMNDLQWRHHGHDHGAMLADRLGMVPVYLRYNTGRHIGHNGAALAQQLQALVTAPAGAQAHRLVLLGHSMGGLVLRSAMHQAAQQGMTWPQRVSDLVCLGSPHLGAPLERAGHGVDILLGATPSVAPLARLGRLRSAGINDLRHGDLLQGAATALEGPPPPLEPKPAHVPLPKHVRCFAIAGSLGREPQSFKGRWLGDGLVPVASALGRHRSAAKRLRFDATRQAVVANTGHLALLSSPAVAERLVDWLDRSDP